MCSIAGLRIPVVPPIQVDPALHRTAQQISNTVRSVISKEQPRTTGGYIPLVPKFYYGTDLSPHGICTSLPTRPDGFVLPSCLLTPQERVKMKPWLTDLVKYGSPNIPRLSSGSDLPDLFSWADRIASNSNGRIQIVTFYREPSIRSDHDRTTAGKTRVYVTPGLAVDLAPLGQAALEFRERFEHLLAPVVEWYNQEAGQVRRSANLRG